MLYSVDPTHLLLNCPEILFRPLLSLELFCGNAVRGSNFLLALVFLLFVAARDILVVEFAEELLLQELLLHFGALLRFVLLQLAQRRDELRQIGRAHV